MTLPTKTGLAAVTTYMRVGAWSEMLFTHRNEPPDCHSYHCDLQMHTPSLEGPTMTITTVSHNDLASLSECLVCFDYRLPPILEGLSGHLVYRNCHPKLIRCPTCWPVGDPFATWLWRSGPFGTFPCEYASSRCEITSTHKQPQKTLSTPKLPVSDQALWMLSCLI